MLANCFGRLCSKGLYQSSGKGKESRCLVFPSSTKCEFFFSRCGRATTTKKCTIKRDALAKLLFCFFGLLVAVAVAVAVVVA